MKQHFRQLLADLGGRGGGGEGGGEGGEGGEGGRGEGGDQAFSHHLQQQCLPH